MKLDMTVVRAILENVESWPADTKLVQVTLDGVDQDEVDQHVILMEESALLTTSASAATRANTHLRLVKGLTMQGHEVLAKLRDDTLWNRVLVKAKSLGETSLTSAWQAMFNWIMQAAAGS